MPRQTLAASLAAVACGAVLAQGSQSMPSYYAHPVSEDRYGVIAPWYKGLNGQLDERVCIAVDVYKRYPWVGTDKAVLAAPDFVYNSHWSIKPDGTIEIPKTNDWRMCGDLSQRAWSIIQGLTSYYRYSGDPIAFLYIPLTVDYCMDYAQTPPDADWPSFPIATPTKGKAYGKCDPTARNQLDLCATLGKEVLRAYKLTGNPRYLTAVKHWGDVFAEKCNVNPAEPPWNRYVDPSVVGWSDVLTGTTTVICDFLDDLIAIGYKGKGGKIVKARDAGRRYLTNVILPQWWVNDMWARTYWDWDNPVMCGMVSMCGDYFLAHREAFPNWRADLRNMLSLIFHRNGADPQSMGDTYNGAWAYPESCTCCGTSLSYCQYTAAPTLLRYGAVANDEWARELGRRMILMATYDSDEFGVVKDGLPGEQVATGEWSNLAHPWPLCQTMEALALIPELGPNRENHIMSSTSVVNSVLYEKGRVTYSTFDAPPGTTDVLRLAFAPSRVTADGKALARGHGYSVSELKNGDCIVTVRHAGAKKVVVEGPDPQEYASGTSTFTFTGNQVRLVGTIGPDGGWADAYLDGEKQLTVVEFWNPTARKGQVLFTRGGLKRGKHELRIIPSGVGNPQSKGTEVCVEGIQYSAATGDAGFGSGGGPTGQQRMIFGYTGRKDYVDSRGNPWRPATEWVIRTGYGTDALERSWWTKRRTMWVGDTPDPELYRYGAHGKEFWVNLTVGPGAYDVTLRFADTPLEPTLERDKNGKRVTHTVTVSINGEVVVRDMNIAEAAGGLFRAVDRTIPRVWPKNGIIRIHFQGVGDGEAIVNAIEVVPSLATRGRVAR